MNIIFAKHKGCNKEFIFEVPSNMLPEKGDILYVDTCRGKDIAVATTDTISGRNIEQIIERYGAYLPLKQVKTYANTPMVNYIKTECCQEFVERWHKLDEDIDEIANLPLPITKAVREEDLPF